MLDKIIVDAEDNLLGNIQKVQDKFYAQLVEVLSEFSNKNKLEYTHQQLAKLKKSIDFAFSNTGYKKYIEAYLSTYDEIEKDNIEFYKDFKGGVENLVLNNDVFKELRSQVANSLLSRNAIDITFIQPIENMLRLDIIKGLTFKEAQENLRTELIKNGNVNGGSKLHSYLKTITRDALRTYDGTIQHEIKKKFDLKVLQYQNSLIKTSRPFCVHMKSKKALDRR